MSNSHPRYILEFSSLLSLEKFSLGFPRLIQILVACLSAAHLDQGGLVSQRLTKFLKLSHLLVTSVVPACFSLVLFKMLTFAIFSLESILAV